MDTEDFNLTFFEAMRELEQGKEVISEFSPKESYYLDEEGIQICLIPKHSGNNGMYVTKNGYFDEKCLKGKWMARERNV